MSLFRFNFFCFFPQYFCRPLSFAASTSTLSTPFVLSLVEAHCLETFSLTPTPYFPSAHPFSCHLLPYSLIEFSPSFIWLGHTPLLASLRYHITLYPFFGLNRGYTSTITWSSLSPLTEIYSTTFPTLLLPSILSFSPVLPLHAQTSPRLASSNSFQPPSSRFHP